MDDDAPCTFAPYSEAKAEAQRYGVPLRHQFFYLNLVRAFLGLPEMVVLGRTPGRYVRRPRFHHVRAA